MKRALKPIIITFLVLGALTGGVIFFLSRGGKVSSQFEKRIAGEQSDQSEDQAFNHDVKNKAVELRMSGEGKNVLNFDSSNVYQVDTSTAARERLDRVIRKASATFEEPVIAANPFGTNANSFYFYFTMPYKGMVRYTVTVEDESVPDLVRYVNGGKENNLSDTHEFTLSGLIPGMTNYIIIDVLDSTGASRDSRIYVYTPPASRMGSRMAATDGKSKEILENGLFFVFPSQDKNIYVYDNSGVLRNCILTETAHGNRIYQAGDNVIYQVSDTKFAMVSAIGRVTGTAEVKGYGKIRDFSYDGYDSAYCLVTKGKKDYLVSVSFKTGETKKVVAFPKGVSAGSLTDPSGGGVYVSCDKPEGIIKLDALTGKTPRISFVLGKKGDWKKVAKKNKTYKKKVAEDPAVVQWSTAGIILNRGNVMKSGSDNLFSTYLAENGKGTGIQFSVDEEKKSVKIEQSFPTGEGGSCSCQAYGNHTLIMNLGNGVYSEYDKEGKVTKSFTVGQPLSGVTKLSLNDMCFYSP